MSYASSKSDRTEQLHLLSCIILVLNGVGDYVPLEASNHRLWLLASNEPNQPLNPKIWKSEDCWHFCFIYIYLLLLWYSLVAESEKAMAPHSSSLAWKIPWMVKPGRLQSMGSLRVGRDWATSLSLFTFMHWRRKWQSTPVFLPGEF